MIVNRFKNDKYNDLPAIETSFKAEVSEQGNSAKIIIYGDIGESLWWESISAVDIERELKGINANTIHVHINSYGGDVFAGIAIYNLLKNHSAKIIIHIDGVAASAASLIAMAGNEIIMNVGSMLMIHEASTIAWGNKTDIKKTLNALEGIDESITDIYMTRYKGEREEIETMLVNETWFTSSEAVEVGFADKVNQEDEDEEIDPEEYKNSILQRFRQEQSTALVAANGNQKNILSRLKRQD